MNAAEEAVEELSFEEAVVLCSDVSDTDPARYPAPDASACTCLVLQGVLEASGPPALEDPAQAKCTVCWGSTLSGEPPCYHVVDDSLLPWGKHFCQKHRERLLLPRQLVREATAAELAATWRHSKEHGAPPSGPWMYAQIDGSVILGRLFIKHKGDAIFVSPQRCNDAESTALYEKNPEWYRDGRIHLTFKKSPKFHLPMSVGSPAANVNASPHKRKEPGASSSLVVQPQRSLSWTDASSSATSSTGPPLLTATIKLGDGDLVRFIAVGLGIEVTLLRDAVPPGLPDRQCVPFLRQQQTGDLGWSRADKFLLEEWQRKSLSRLQGPASHTSSAEFNAAIETVIDTYLEGTGIDSTSLHVTRRGTYFDIRLDGELPPTPQEDDVLKANLQSSLTALAGQQVDVIALENGSIIVQCWCPASELPSALVGIATLCGRDVLPFEDGKPSPRVANAWEVQAARESVERIRTLIVGTLIEGIRTRIGPLSLDETRQLDSLQRQLYSLQSALPERRADPEAVLAAVRWRGLELQYAAEELRADLEIVLVAVRQHGAALQFAAEKLRADGQVVLAAVQQGGFALQFASPELKADRNVVLAAVRQDSCALQYASATLRADREIVLIAVRQHGAALQHASEEMMDDCEVVLTAVAENAASVSLASARMKADREFMLLAMQQNGAALGFASDELRADREVILAAVRQDGRALASASEELRNDREIVLAAMRQNGLVAAMGLVPRELHEDQEVQELLETAMSRLRLRPS